MTCAWLVEVPSGNPEPDCKADTIKIVECGRPAVGERALCDSHAAMVDMPDMEFEALYGGEQQ